MPPELIDFLASLPIALSVAAVDGDHPLLFTNQPFSDLTGYAPDQSIGRNCRFLQRDISDGLARAKLRVFFANDDALAVRAPIINFRKDGSAFVNLLYLTRLRAASGETCFFLGSQFDVSRMEVERLRNCDLELSGALATLAPLAAECGMAVDHALSAVGDAVSLMAQAQLTLAALPQD